MKTVKKILISALLSLFFTLGTAAAYAWHDETHLAVAKAAGYYKWYNAVGADIAKTKAGSIEAFNHFFNNISGLDVTPDMALGQAERYNSPKDPEGHLYGAIIASLRDYDSHLKKGKYAEYHVALCAHYIADLSEPLHNVSYDEFNKAHHETNDSIVEKEVLKNISRIKKHMYPVSLGSGNFEEGLAKEIARIANQAGKLAHTLKKENRDMTKEEAYKQLGQSASLLRAVLIYLGKINPVRELRPLRGHAQQ